MKIKSTLYEQKGENYFNQLNPYILSLLEKSNTYLEIGCGSGEIGKYVKHNNLYRELYGIEISDSSAELARQYFNHVYTGDLEEFDFSQLPNADTIVCGDVLEHLVDPWIIFTKIANLLAKDGSIIISVPNVRHIRVWLPLVVKGKFIYTSHGLLDKGHLRFFTLYSLLAMVEENGLYVEKILYNISSRMKIINILTFGIFKNFFSIQYIIRVRRKKHNVCL